MLSPINYEVLKYEIATFEGNHLEIGAFYGEGVRSLALEFPNKHFYVIDPFIEDGYTSWISNKNRGESMPHIREVAIQNMNLPNITHYEMTTEDFIKSNIKLDNVKTIMIDGSHIHEDVIIDIDFSLDLLKGIRGMIFMDDTNKPDVLAAYSKYFPFKSDGKYTVKFVDWYRIVIGNF